MPISNLVECIQFAEKELQGTGLKAPMVGHVGDGNFHVTIVYDPKKDNEYKYIRDFSNKLIKVQHLELSFYMLLLKEVRKDHYQLLKQEIKLSYLKKIKRLI